MTPTLEAVEHLANQLSEQDQKVLLKRLNVKLHVFVPDAPQEPADQNEYHAKRKRLARQLLTEVESLSEDDSGMLDATETIRQLREGRHLDISGDVR